MEQEYDEMFDCSEYSLLLRQLYDTTFIIYDYDDTNRTSDGYFLREEFCTVEHIPSRRGTGDPLAVMPCCLLELMLGLCERIEREYLGGGYEPTTWLWFYSMLDSLGLLAYTDDAYDADAVNGILSAFMGPICQPNKRGTLFYIPQKYAKYRAHSRPIWEQMQAWISYIWKRGELYGYEL